MGSANLMAVLTYVVVGVPIDDDEIEIVGETGDGGTAIEMVGRLRPEVIVTDIKHPPEFLCVPATATPLAGSGDRAGWL